MHSLNFRLAINIIFILIFIFFIEYWVGWTPLLESWILLNPTSILFLTLILYLSYLVRAIRIYSFFNLNNLSTYPTCVKLVLEHTFFNNILPMRTGEISFPILMSRYFDIPNIKSIPALLWFRLLDLHTITSFGLFFILIQGKNTVLAIPIFIIWVCLPWIGYNFSNSIQHYIANNVNTKYTKLLNKVLHALPLSSSSFLVSWIWTIINWLLKLIALVGILQLFSSIPLAIAWLSVITGDLTSILPIHSIAGIGTYETGIVSILSSFGVDIKEATQVAINIHFFVLATIVSGYFFSQWINPIKK